MSDEQRSENTSFSGFSSPEPPQELIPSKKSDQTSSVKGNKRKREAPPGEERQQARNKNAKISTHGPETGKNNSRKRRKKEQVSQGTGVLKQTSINEDIAKMDGTLMADYLARQIKRFQPDLSVIELEERRISDQAFLDTSSYSESRELHNLAAFLKHFARPKREILAEAPGNLKGSPHTLVITAAALRAADIVRTLRVYQAEDAIVAKLFAKHIKLKDAANFVRNTGLSIGVGTPSRVRDLVNEGALSLDYLERIVLDASHINEKKRGLLEMKESVVPLVEFLALHSTRERHNTNGEARTTEIIVF